MLQILKDKRLKSLLDRVGRADAHYTPGCVVLCGYNKGKETQHVAIYSNRQDFESNFTRETRAQLDGRIVHHEVGAAEYECLTDIVDKSPLPVHGRWVLSGYDKKGGKIAKLFKNKQAMTAGQDEYLKQMIGIAVAHEVGTHDYTVIDVAQYWDNKDLIDVSELGFDTDNLRNIA